MDLPIQVHGIRATPQNNSESGRKDLWKLRAISVPPILLENSLCEPATVLQQTVDSSLRGTFAYQSLRIAVEITINYLNKEPSRRPSMEDVLWYLQYSIQVQQTWTSSGNLGLNSGNLGMHLQR